MEGTLIVNQQREKEKLNQIKSKRRKNDERKKISLNRYNDEAENLAERHTKQEVKIQPLKNR